MSSLKTPFSKFSDIKNNSRIKVKIYSKLINCFKLSEIMVGSGIRKKPIPYPGSRIRGQKGTGSGSATLLTPLKKYALSFGAP
jgi:hypothetical protein